MNILKFGRFLTRGRILPPWVTSLNNSITVQDIKMKFQVESYIYGGYFARNDNSH